jgi:hypothetical protein
VMEQLLSLPRKRMWKVWTTTKVELQRLAL